MKLITFLLIAFLISCIFTLKQDKESLKEIIDLQDEEISKQDSLILEIQKSNRLYIDAALKNK